MCMYIYYDIIILYEICLVHYCVINIQYYDDMRYIILCRSKMGFYTGNQ